MHDQAMKIDGSFNALDRGGGNFDVLFTPHDFGGGSVGARHVSSVNGLSHFMSILGNPLLPDQLKTLQAGGSLAGSITPKHFAEYFSK
ncbi:MAG TPA: hypothetical protein VGQ49_00665 [Bryobacteraceae bacterium]|jgi:hypothetical protein|nr:hypothetical protein [Bryobacteraceae bacterium]